TGQHHFRVGAEADFGEGDVGGALGGEDERGADFRHVNALVAEALERDAVADEVLVLRERYADELRRGTLVRHGEGGLFGGTRHFRGDQQHDVAVGLAGDVDRLQGAEREDRVAAVDLEAAGAFLHEPFGHAHPRAAAERFGGGGGEAGVAAGRAGIGYVQRPARGGDSRGEEGARVSGGGDAGIFRECGPGGGGGGISQPVPERVEFAVGHVGGARPCRRELAREVEARLALGVADDDVGEAGAFGAGQPGDDEGVGGVERGVHVERAARDHDRYDRDALLLELAHRLVGRRELGIELERGAVALELGVRLFAEDHDGGVGLGGEAAVGRQFGEAAGADDRLLQAVPQRRRAGEVAVVDAGTLPGQGPAARLAGDVVGPVACDEQAPARLQGQHALVLEKDERLAHSFAGELAVFGRAEQLPFARHRAGG